MTTPVAILGPIGFQEILIILAIVLILFGGRKLPELARAMGSSINQFKRGLKEEAEESEKLAAPKEGETKPKEP